MGVMLSPLICRIVEICSSPRKHAGLAIPASFRRDFALLLRLQNVGESMAPGFFLAVTLLFLIGCGTQPPTTVRGKSFEYWQEALHDPDARIRTKAVESLGNVGADNPSTVPALIRVLDDREARVRGAAVLALLKIGPDAQEAIPALQKTLKDKDAKVRAYATKALERINGTSG
jgi:HEAT repeat protein